MLLRESGTQMSSNNRFLVFWNTDISSGPEAQWVRNHGNKWKQAGIHWVSIIMEYTWGYERAVVLTTDPAAIPVVCTAQEHQGLLEKKKFIVNIGYIQPNVRTKSKVNDMLCSPEIPPHGNVLLQHLAQVQMSQKVLSSLALIPLSSSASHRPEPGFQCQRSCQKLAKSEIRFNFQLSQFFHLPGCKMLNSLIPAGILKIRAFSKVKGIKIATFMQIGNSFPVPWPHFFHAWNWFFMPAPVRCLCCGWLVLKARRPFDAAVYFFIHRRGAVSWQLSSELADFAGNF